MKDADTKYIPGVTKLMTKIPIERIKILKGVRGENIRFLEERLGVVINIDESLGSVTIEPRSGNTSIENLLRAKNYIEAVGAGFSPDVAERVLEEDQILLIIDLKDQLRLPENHLRRIKARIIGEGGRVKRNLEEISGCSISIYDNVVAIIGDYENANAVKEAIELIVEGREHSTVYRHLRRLIVSSKKSFKRPQ